MMAVKTKHSRYDIGPFFVTLTPEKVLENKSGIGAKAFSVESNFALPDTTRYPVLQIKIIEKFACV